MNAPRSTPARLQRGASMMEALVAMLIVAFGVLGFAGLQARTAVSGLEAYQREQALVLLKDMAQRMNLNRLGAVRGYYSQPVIGGNACVTTTASPATTEETAALATANADLCAWHDLLKGAAEVDSGGNRVGAMQGARGCITALGGANEEFLVALYWQGAQGTGTTQVTCAGSQASAVDGIRRGVSTVVRLANL